jgi:hypothetical protein
MLPAIPLLASKSAAEPLVCNAKAELFGMPEAAVAVPLEAPLLDDEFDEEPLEFVELEAAVMVAGGGVTGVNVAFLVPKPRAAA